MQNQIKVFSFASNNKRDMLSKSKIEKLRKDLKKLGVSNTEMSDTIGYSEATLIRILNGKQYNYDALVKLVGLRDDKLKANEALAKAI